MNNRCFLGLGSNLGNKKENLYKAKEFLKQKNIKIIKESIIHETEPMYYSKQDNFLNQVIEIKTEYNPEDLLKIISGIEKN
jgi:2-amino-4-hydroxy-6-hydroxymethyldihydropteridine diphosphokinase